MMETELMYFPELPSYLEVFKVIDYENEEIRILVKSRIHVQREMTFQISYGSNYVSSYPKKFRAEVLQYIVEKYGLRLEPTKYS